MAQSVSKRFDDLGADGAPAKLGIMGGTFDPIHIGHLTIAEQALRAYGLDAVLFVPAGKPVFKRDTQVTPGAMRLEMCRRAVADNLFFDVSPIEVEREGDTYTVDTLKELRQHYPDNVEFYFITGSDAGRSIAKWRESQEIARLAHLVVATRPGYPVSDEDKRAIEGAGAFDVSYLQVTSLDVSSSAVRALLGRGESARYLVPEQALSYIDYHGLYKPAPTVDPKAQDPFSDAFIEARTKDLDARLKPKRVKHVMGVADLSKRLAKEYGVDKKHAYLAGLLHDWDKNYDDAGIRARARQLQLDIDPIIFDNMPQVMHGPTAAAALAREWPQIPADVIQAIRRHTAGAVGMTDLDMIVYTADALEPSRDFPGVDDLRKLIGKVSLEELFFAVFQHTFLNLVERGRRVHPDTVKVWNVYSARDRQRRKDK